jgi:hypothetical protein
MESVKFGTDGWRGIIADDFTYEKVRVAARAIADYVNGRGNAAKCVCGGGIYGSGREGSGGGADLGGYSGGAGVRAVTRLRHLAIRR